MNGLARLFVEQAIVFGWVLSRVAGFVVASPFPGADVPATARMILALAVSFVVSSYAQPAVAVGGLDLHTVVVVLGELGCGVAIGLIFRLLMSVADMAGEMIAHAVGLSTGAVLNPEAASPDPTLTRIISLSAMLIALGMGAHRVVLAHVLESFRSLPVGSVLDVGAAAPAIAALVGETLATGLRLALPVVAVCLLAQLGMAIIARAAPAMQIFNVGLSITLGGGLLTVLSAANDLGLGIAEQLGHLPEKLGQILLVMAGK